MLRVASGTSAPFLLSRLRPLLPPPPARGRKSRHDPPAKSKAGRVNRPPPVDPEELLVVRERYRQYREVLSALRAEFQEVVMRKRYEEKLGTLAAERAQQEIEEHRMLMAWNDAENARMHLKREERTQQEQKKEQQRKLQAAIHRETLDEQFLQEKTQEVLQLQEEAKHFITKENLDQRIEAALDNPKNYNFSIDKEGRVAKRTAVS
ncbi:small ribosomal subunit protein mS26 [Microcaecilia unicolor]|uniref:Small ribosomal subunit protein mS26 n=1 Tax=Microcaecilia unicolor TaxID=1415580 RepID=A0A6P7X881_9AMPH|nr:28S ribosomal protein S26, mitochondrial [Microcaecilia unicolor]